MTDQELENEVDRLMDGLIGVIDGENALASDLALCEVMAAGCCDIDDCRRMMDLTLTALTYRIVELASETEVLH